jgi:hypothetical protein
MPAPKCHFDAEVTAETGSATARRTSEVRRDVKTIRNRDLREVIFGGNGGRGRKSLRCKDLERRLSEVP